ncbi:MAG: sulfatase-like hydrolase/transferase [Deltaproteobacteria bacterium]|nr:sulfatase-like hydrolase/transferase [Deltaproteobacteria bacterium]
MLRIVVAAAAVIAWTLCVTAIEHELATWAPAVAWRRIALINGAVAIGIVLAIHLATLSRSGRWFGGAFAAVVAVSLALIPVNVRGPGTVIWVVCDTLRADRMSLYGHGRETSPFFEEWAPELLVFDQGYSQASHTIVSAPAILASLYPSTHGLRDYHDVLDSRAVLVSEALQNAGFTTFGVLSNPHLSAKNGFNQGFDQFKSTKKWKNLSSAKVNQSFFDWRIRHTDGTPYFALLWYIDPHTPFQWDEEASDWAGLDPGQSFRFRPDDVTESASEEIRKSTSRRYDASVRAVDNALRNLTAFLREVDDYDDALIVFTSDHGESMWEHGRFGHNYGLYESLTHVPLAIRFPSPLRFPYTTPPTGRSEMIVSSVDLLPTTLDFLGIEADSSLQGRSILPSLGGSDPGVAYLEQRLERYGPYHVFGLREGRHKYIWVESFEDNRLPRMLLFDLAADPGEQHNIISEQPDLAASFHARVVEQRRKYEALALERATVSPDRESRKLLEKLGYIEEKDAADGR